MRSVSSYARVLTWPVLLAVYALLRFLFGVSYGLIYGFLIVLFMLKVRIEQILLMFFFLSVGLYVFGQDVEANHMMSFVFALIILTLGMHVYASVHVKKSKK